jgi:hypothetical protein
MKSDAAFLAPMVVILLASRLLGRWPNASANRR